MTKQKTIKIFSRILASAMIIVMVASLMTGCVGGKINKAVLKDVNGVVFGEAMEKLAAIAKEADNVQKFSYKWQKKWKGDEVPVIAELDADEEPVTFVLKIVSKEDGEKSTDIYKFYMGYNKITNELAIYGGATEAKGEKNTYSAADAAVIAAEMVRLATLKAY